MLILLDSGIRRNDEKPENLIFYEAIKIDLARELTRKMYCLTKKNYISQRSQRHRDLKKIKNDFCNMICLLFFNREP